MSRLVAFRCRDRRYLLARTETSPAWLTNPSVEHLGELKADSFAPSVASEIALQIATRRFAMVSEEQFYFSRASTAVG